MRKARRGLARHRGSSGARTDEDNVGIRGPRKKPRGLSGRGETSAEDCKKEDMQKKVAAPTRLGETKGPARSRDEVEGEVAADSKSAVKKKGKVNLSIEKAFTYVEDIDIEILRLKKPPRELKKANFSTNSGLPTEGDSPHHFCQNAVFSDLLRKLFKRLYGDGGRNGLYF